MQIMVTATDVKELTEEINNHVESLEKRDIEREKLLEVFEDNYDNIPINNLTDELKVKVIARLYKNLTLEQLENLEQTVKNTFAAKKKNYILELP